MSDQVLRSSTRGGDLRAWPNRPDGAQLKADRAEVERLLHDAHWD